MCDPQTTKHLFQYLLYTTSGLSRIRIHVLQLSHTLQHSTAGQRHICHLRSAMLLQCCAGWLQQRFSSLQKTTLLERKQTKFTLSKKPQPTEKARSKQDLAQPLHIVMNNYVCGMTGLGSHWLPLRALNLPKSTKIRQNKLLGTASHTVIF